MFSRSDAKPLRVSVRAQLWAAMLLPVGAVLLVLIVVLNFAGQAGRIQDEIARTERLRTDTLRVSRDLVAAESAVRGYRLAGAADQDFLDPYFAAMRQAPAQLRALRERSQGLPLQAELIAELEVLVNQRLESLTELRRAPSSAPPGSRAAVTRLAEGRRLTQQIQQRIDELAEAQQELAVRRRAALASAQRGERLAVLAIPLALLLSIASVALLGRRMVRRVRVLERNTVNLVEGRPLEPLPHGGDELERVGDALIRAEHLLDQRERQRLAAQREAERANHAKTAFLSRMSHELRTPLTAVLGFAELLELDDLDDNQRDSVRHIRSAGRHLLTLINEVLDISRIETGTLSVSIEPVDVGGVVADAVSLIRPMAEERGIRLPRRCGDGVYVRADRQRLTQILLNVLSNAVKYNRDFGEIRLDCAVVGDTVRVSISDTGSGIAPELLPRVFAPFDRLGAEQTGIEGTGVGLTLSKGLAEAMGGALTLESVLGEGTTLILELVTAQPSVEEPQYEDADTAELSEAPVTVLYVEDNEANLDLVSAFLRRLPGVELIAAMQGRLAMDLARTHRPDLVLLDLHLPDLDGETVLRRLQDDPETAVIPVAMLTADATPGQERRLRALGAVDYITKPLDFGRVIRLLDQVRHDGVPA